MGFEPGLNGWHFEMVTKWAKPPWKMIYAYWYTNIYKFEKCLIMNINREFNIENWMYNTTFFWYTKNCIKFQYSLLMYNITSCITTIEILISLIVKTLTSSNFNSTLNFKEAVIPCLLPACWLSYIYIKLHRHLIQTSDSSFCLSFDSTQSNIDILHHFYISIFLIITIYRLFELCLLWGIL